ncbi:MAG: DUF6410 domain-containing protein, partial [Actinoallomurus sp.]
FVLGRDAGPYGRIARVLAGAWLVLAGVSQVAHDGLGLVEVAELLGYALAAALLYLAATYLFGVRTLTRLNTWTASALLLLPVMVVYALSAVAVPRPLLAGLYAYVGVSVLLIGMVGYGGCEIVGLPVILLRRRYVVYCALNAIDAAERPLTHGPGRSAHRVAGLLAVVAGAYYFLLQPLFGLLGVRVPFAPRWGVLLLLPAIAVLARQAWRERHVAGWTAGARDRGIGTLALAANAVGILVFGSVLYVYFVLTAAVFLTGVVQGIRQAVCRGAPEPDTETLSHDPGR